MIRINLTAYAEKTKLPLEFLRRLDIREEQGNLVIPYYDSYGDPLRERIRNGSKRWWSAGEVLAPYLLNLLPDEGERVFLAEGESDAQTLCYHRYTTLGIPGASTFRPKWVECVRNFKALYIVPDTDHGGEVFTNKVLESLSAASYEGEVYVVHLPKGTKDVNELHCQDPDAFSDIFASLVEDAKQVSPVPSLYSNRDSGTLSIRRLRDINEPAPMGFIVEDFVPENYPTMFYGDGGQGKSYLILCLGTCVAEGKDFLGKATQKGNVLYVDFELDEAEQARRAWKVARGLGLEEPPEGLFYFSPVSQDKAVKDIGAIIDDLASLIAENDIKLTIIDSFGAAVAGDPESARDVTGLFRNLRRLGTTIILDHQSKASADRYKDKTAFGSVYKQNMSRNIWQLQRMLDTVTADNEIKLALHHKKSNFGPLRETICLKATFGQAYSIERVDPDIDFSDALSTKDQVFMAFVELGQATAKEVSDDYGISLKTVKNKVTALKQEGKLKPTGEKREQSHVYEPTVPMSHIYKDRDRDTGEQLSTEPVITKEGRCEYDF